jgi:mRNA interferase HigB
LRVISKKKLRNFWQVHRDAEDALSAWYCLAEKVDWAKPNDVRNSIRSADPVGDEFVVFDICNNDYRLVVCADYENRIIYIWDVLTHAEYERLDLKALAEEKKREKQEARKKKGR